MGMVGELERERAPAAELIAVRRRISRHIEAKGLGYRMARKDKFQTITADTGRLLDGQEGRNVDFKIDPKAISSEDIVAFVNAAGGTILAGVEEIDDDGIQKGRVVGCKVDDKTRQAIMGRASSCRPVVDIAIRIENARSQSPILRIDIPNGKDKPYATSSGTYKIRSEGKNLAIDPPLMKAIILESEADEFVARFRHAADGLIQRIETMSADLSHQIGTVRRAAEIANESAQRAEAAAQEAIGAAYDAAAAAEDAAMGDY
jgi:hypothetical protein